MSALFTLIFFISNLNSFSLLFEALLFSAFFSTFLVCFAAFVAFALCSPNPSSFTALSPFSLSSELNFALFMLIFSTPRAIFKRSKLMLFTPTSAMLAISLFFALSSMFFTFSSSRLARLLLPSIVKFVFVTPALATFAFALLLSGALMPLSAIFSSVRAVLLFAKFRFKFEAFISFKFAKFLSASSILRAFAPMLFSLAVAFSSLFSFKFARSEMSLKFSDFTLAVIAFLKEISFKFMALKFRAASVLSAILLTRSNFGSSSSPRLSSFAPSSKLSPFTFKKPSFKFIPVAFSSAFKA